MNNQFKKGIIEICVLKFISSSDRYGYEVVKELQTLLQIKESTVYPILKRLKNDLLVDTYLVESDIGPARKYYKITVKGQSQLDILSLEWDQFSNAITTYLKS